MGPSCLPTSSVHARARMRSPLPKVDRASTHLPTGLCPIGLTAVLRWGRAAARPCRGPPRSWQGRRSPCGSPPGRRGRRGSDAPS
eukprot:4298800-Pyramimonas_sp.AAC.1